MALNFFKEEGRIWYVRSYCVLKGVSGLLVKSDLVFVEGYLIKYSSFFYLLLIADELWLKLLAL